jgi:hypothetical protein
MAMPKLVNIRVRDIVFSSERSIAGRAERCFVFDSLFRPGRVQSMYRLMRHCRREIGAVMRILPHTGVSFVPTENQEAVTTPFFIPYLVAWLEILRLLIDRLTGGPINF